MKKSKIKLSPAEIQSGSSRVKHAEGLIQQLPADHEGRNTWLLNYGVSDEAEQIRKNWHDKHSSKPLVPVYAWSDKFGCLIKVE